MTFAPKVKVYMEKGEVKAVMIRQPYYPRIGKIRGRELGRKPAYRWVMADYVVESEQDI